MPAPNGFRSVGVRRDRDRDGPVDGATAAAGGEPALNGDMVAQALAGIDDITVLLEERPVTVDSLWRHLISSSIGNDCEPVTLLHPSWWPQRWVARIVDAATSVVPEVAALSAVVDDRPRLRRRDGRRTGDEVVAVCRGVGAAAHPSSIGRRIRDRRGGSSADQPDWILIDVPHGVPAVSSSASPSEKLFSTAGSSPTWCLEETSCHRLSSRQRRLRSVARGLSAQVAAAAVVGIVVCGVGVATTSPVRVSAAGSDTVSLVEGRVTSASRPGGR